jgi:hypothetical protein
MSEEELDQACDADHGHPDKCRHGFRCKENCVHCMRAERNQLTAERDQWRELAEKAEAECEELRQSEQDWCNMFGILRSAEMRGVRMWQKETGKKLTLPDRARFVVWLLNKLDAAGLLEEVSEIK